MTSLRDALDTRARDGFQRLTIPVRRGYYGSEHPSRLVAHAPMSIRRRLGLDDDAAIGSRRIEIGPGPFPTPGYLHVDIDPGARHIEARAPAWQLPFSDGWAQEIVAVHSLEHVHPRRFVPTLREWRRVLAPGGTVRVHVPNTPELMTAFLEGPAEHRWSIMGAMLGMYCGPEVRDPAELPTDSDHQLMLDAGMLIWAFEQAGFEAPTDLTDQIVDRHTESWRGIVPHFSLVMEAAKAS